MYKTLKFYIVYEILNIIAFFPFKNLLFSKRKKKSQIVFLASIMDVIEHKTFPRQAALPHVVVKRNPSVKLRASKKEKDSQARWYKDIGLGFKTPSEAIEGTYVDKKCPFTGNVSIRGRIISGVIASMKMKRTIVVRRDYLHYVPKYNRYEKRHKNFTAHLSPCFIGCEIGDFVVCGECRPLSKTVRFNVLRVQKQESKGSKKFEKF
jgi:small subunit ribosomal protein S11e